MPNPRQQEKTTKGSRSPRSSSDDSSSSSDENSWVENSGSSDNEEQEQQHEVTTDPSNDNNAACVWDLENHLPSELEYKDQGRNWEEVATNPPNSLHIGSRTAAGGQEQDNSTTANSSKKSKGKKKKKSSQNSNSGSTGGSATNRSRTSVDSPVVPAAACVDVANYIVEATVHDPEKERREIERQLTEEMAEMQRKRMFKIAGGVVLFLVAVAVAITVAVIMSGDDKNNQDKALTPDDTPFNLSEVIISDLCSPRHLTVYKDMLYVPEGGVGPLPIPANETEAPNCLQSPAFKYYICFGRTGRVVAYDLDGKHAGPPVLENLFSARAISGRRGTNEVYGVHQVEFDEETDRMVVLVGQGYINASELVLIDEEMGEQSAAILGPDKFLVASIWQTEYVQNFNQRITETNPFGMAIHQGNLYVVDAGGDTLYAYIKPTLDDSCARCEKDQVRNPDKVVLIDQIKGVKALTTGSCNDVTPPKGPSWCGQYQDFNGDWLYDTAPVPTTVKVHDNRLYVAFLSGVFWNEPNSNIWEYELDGRGLPLEKSKQLFLPGNTFWAIIDFAFYKQDVIVLETRPGGDVPFDGRLSKVHSNGTVEVLWEELSSPTGLAITNDGMIFVANNAGNGGPDTCFGEVLRGKLPL